MNAGMGMNDNGNCKNDSGTRNSEPDTKREVPLYVADDEPPFHENWKGFTQKLRDLMQEQPTLPVVITCAGAKDVELDCSISYVHDRETGIFVEKIISIFDMKDFDKQQEPLF